MRSCEEDDMEPVFVQPQKNDRWVANSTYINTPLGVALYIGRTKANDLVLCIHKKANLPEAEQPRAKSGLLVHWWNLDEVEGLK